MSDLADLLKAPGASIEALDDFDAVNALYLERGWGDGLPIVSPSAERRARRGDARLLRSPVERADRENRASLRRSNATIGRAEDIIIAVIGGAGKHSAHIPLFVYRP